MSSIQVRRFRRDDRVQLTALVNAHVAAVIPGVTVSVNTVLSQLEREPGEFIVDPWVADRLTLVAEQRGRIVGAAHLLRYRPDDDVGPDYRDAGEIRWFLFWPPAPYWHSDDDVAGELMAASLAAIGRGAAARSSPTARCRPRVCTASQTSGRMSRARSRRSGSRMAVRSSASSSRMSPTWPQPLKWRA